MSVYGSGVFPGNAGEPFTGASAISDGISGSVPQPVIGDQNNFLKGDGTWAGIGAPTGYQTVQDEGTGLAQQTTINFIGANVTAVDNPGANRTDVTISAGAFPFTDQAASTTMVINNGYVTSGAGLVTLTLPAIIPFGAVFEVVGIGAGGWKIAQNAGQNIHFSISTTTTGAGGSVASTNNTDTARLVCVVANTSLVLTAPVGTLNIT